MEERFYYHPDMNRELTPKERAELDELFWQNEQIPYGEEAQETPTGLPRRSLIF